MQLASQVCRAVHMALAAVKQYLSVSVCAWLLIFKIIITIIITANTALELRQKHNNINFRCMFGLFLLQYAASSAAKVIIALIALGGGVLKCVHPSIFIPMFVLFFLGFLVFLTFHHQTWLNNFSLCVYVPFLGILNKFQTYSYNKQNLPELRHISLHPLACSPLIVLHF